ncbi:hypothetical protein E2562_025560 [Oryza meyeriana var. granulata]|uniref:Uncharacterized protein n=1 Tax=Oryza meyeriana var. granulata TaxID=110450 RepID=A0A6G1DAP4_9ORYZ|nr:hypothetical protein E2562_036703 [Oryza meyeriana var. granulata]KAF0909835.1 hypothetical protein E2562_000149 [Oryza meyeriana var. granulata]KAF0920933.1 hypothetical protein E2562_037780 [Oryza meyeriana var. granulata]KAF0932327.1 hypothetical protein E2562_009586 [Oryza meyeriana var. granulata]KAF0934483.1 hypothetical protein E2562_025560 [Oryza meyeriana var. granulata]
MEKRAELVRCCAEKTHGGVEETRAQRSRSAAAARYSTAGTVHPRCYGTLGLDRGVDGDLDRGIGSGGGGGGGW